MYICIYVEFSENTSLLGTVVPGRLQPFTIIFNTSINCIMEHENIIAHD